MAGIGLLHGTAFPGTVALSQDGASAIASVEQTTAAGGRARVEQQGGDVAAAIVQRGTAGASASVSQSGRAHRAGIEQLAAVGPDASIRQAGTANDATVFQAATAAPAMAAVVQLGTRGVARVAQSAGGSIVGVVFQGPLVAQGAASISQAGSAGAIAVVLQGALVSSGTGADLFRPVEADAVAARAAMVAAAPAEFVSATIAQAGAVGSTAEIVQRGVRLQASIVQSGTCERAQIEQAGVGHRAAVVQSAIGTPSRNAEVIVTQLGPLPHGITITQGAWSDQRIVVLQR